MSSKNIIISLIVLLIIILITFKFCANNGDKYKQQSVDTVAQHAYEDTISAIRAEASLQREKAEASKQRIESLEYFIDSLTKKHTATKQKLQKFNNDTGYVIAPNEYVNECETCFDTLSVYKTANKQLRFERDAYDSLMRTQNEINEARVKEEHQETLKWNKRYNDCMLATANNSEYYNTTTWKLKLNLLGGLYNRVPNTYGGGLIYEDKKSNEFGLNFVTTPNGNVVIFNMAKTISFKRKK